jgi:hypothetical protein
MNMAPNAACAMCVSYSPTTSSVRRDENWRTEIAAMTVGAWRTQSVESETLLRAILAFSCRLTQKVTSALNCFPRRGRRAQRPEMPRGDAFGRLPLSSLSRTAL